MVTGLVLRHNTMNSSLLRIELNHGFTFEV